MKKYLEVSTRRKLIGIMLTAAIAAGLTGCGDLGSTSTGAVVADTQTTEAQKEEVKDGAREEDKKEDSEASDSEGASDFHIGIITGSVSRSENGRRSAGASQAMYGEDVVKLTIYPDNFTEELETIIQTIINPSNDPKMKAIITNQSVPGITEALYKIEETCPDTFCTADEGHGGLPEIGSTADLACNNDFIVCGYPIIHTAYGLSRDTFVHVSFLRRMAYKTMSRCVAVMKKACKEFDVEFALEIVSNPTPGVGVAGTQTHILERVPGWVEKYGRNAAYLCTSDTHTEPLLKQLMEYDGYFIEMDLPSLLMGYLGALDIGLIVEAGDSDKISAEVKSTIVERGGTDHFGTWVYSYGYITSAGLVQHALNVLNGESELDDIDDVAKAYQVFSPKAKQNGSDHTNVETDVKLDNVFLIYQGICIIDGPGHFMGFIKTEVPKKYSTIK